MNISEKNKPSHRNNDNEKQKKNTQIQRWKNGNEKYKLSQSKTQ